MMMCPLTLYSCLCHLSPPLIFQMSQELGITEKSPDFTNPYRTERDDVSKIPISINS